MRTVKNKTARLLCWICFLVGIDLVSKVIARKLGVGFVNTGISWGLAQNIPLWFNLLVSVFLNGVLFWALYRDYDSNMTEYTLMMILSGGLGNTVSRVMWGGVWDWISIWKFPSFNFADMLISIGTALFVFSYLVNDWGNNKSTENGGS
jgi:signal peptidase II